MPVRAEADPGAAHHAIGADEFPAPLLGEVGIRFTPLVDYPLQSRHSHPKGAPTSVRRDCTANYSYLYSLKWVARKFKGIVDGRRAGISVPTIKGKEVRIEPQDRFSFELKDDVQVVLR